MPKALENDPDLDGDDTEIDVEVQEQDTPEDQPEEQAAVPDGIDELRRQLEAERAARAEAERAARAAVMETHTAKQEVADTNLQLVSSAIDTLNADLTALKGGYAQAMADQDFLRAAEINAQITEQMGNLHQLKLGRDAMLQAPKVAPPEPHADPVEKFTASLSPASAAWIRAHPECVRDPRMNSRMLLAHAIAVDDGLVVDSPEYFALIETRLGMRRAPAKAEDTSALSEAAAPVKRRDAAPEAAPVSRDGPPGARPNVVRLTREEREMAEVSGLTPEQYAANKLQLKKEGRLQ